MSEAQTIVTGETREAFMNHRMGLSEPVKEAVIDEPIEAELEAVEDAEEVEAVHEEKKPNSKIEKRFSDLTKQREEARADAIKVKSENEALIARIAEFEAKAAPAKDLDAEPNPADYTDVFEFNRDVAKFVFKQESAAVKQQEAQKQVDADRQTLAKHWNDKLEAVKIDYPDFDSIIANSDVGVTDAVRDAIVESEVGARILLHLAQNPEQTQKIGAMTMTAALREIGKIEAKYEAAPEVKIELVKAQVSRAAAPISPIRGGKSLEIELSADGEYTGSFASYKQARAAGKLK